MIKPPLTQYISLNELLNFTALQQSKIYMYVYKALCNTFRITFNRIKKVQYTRKFIRISVYMNRLEVKVTASYNCVG